MKKIIILSLFFLSLADFLQAQILSRIKDEIKWRAEQKAMQKINQAVDKTIDSIGKKKENKRSKAITHQGPAEPGVELTRDTIPATETNLTLEKKESENEVTQQEGFISLTLSADKIFTGGILNISGKSVLYKEYNAIEITITGKSYLQKKTVTLISGGTFNTIWNVPGTEGEYTVTAISSDKKATDIKKVTVYDIPDLPDMPEDNIEQTEKAFANLENKIALVKPKISTAQATELNKKLKELKEKKDAAIKLFNSIKEANKKLAGLAKKGTVFPRNLSQNLSELNTKLKQQSEDMKRIQELSNHEPFDNSICEYLVMLNEACAAFSTFTNLWAKSVEAVIQNILVDKVVPTTIGMVNEEIGSPIPASADVVTKEAAKLYLTSMVDAKSLTEKLGIAGIAGDFITYVTDVLMKIFCGVYKGELTHNYTMAFFNNDGETWWKYGVAMKAAISLRYPKDGNSGKFIKMKGNIEGNATKFTFYANPKEAMATELKEKGAENVQMPCKYCV